MNVFDRIAKVIAAWGLPVPVMGEPNPDAYARVADALEWAQKRIKALEGDLGDVTS